MKYVKEIVIIFGITMVGELLNKFIPLPVPAGVYGLFILLGGLCSGIIKLSDVEVTGNLLLDLMPVMDMTMNVVTKVMMSIGIMTAFSSSILSIIPTAAFTGPPPTGFRGSSTRRRAVCFGNSLS